MITLKVTLPNLSEKMKELLPVILMEMVATVQTNRAMLFNREGAYNGHPKWKPIKRKGMILSDTGNLRRSIAPGAPTKSPRNGIVRVNDRIVTLETRVIYAATHENGDPRRNIKRRSFMQRAWNAQDQREIRETMTRKIERLWNQ